MISLHRALAAVRVTHPFRDLATAAESRFENSQQSDLSYNGRDYQFLHESIVPTDKFQRSLPRLPIPKLEVTLQRYLASQKPILSEEALARTQKAAERFLRGQGKILDRQLRELDRTNKHTSYINQPWTHVYLSDRRPLVFNHNPGIMIAHDERMRQMDLRAANVLISALRFHKSLRSNLLRPEVFHLRPSKTNNDTYWNRVRFMPDAFAAPLSYLFKAFPLDMVQYDNLFQSTRIPLKDKDEIRRFPEAKHMLVMCRNRFYAFDVYDRNWNLFPPSYYLGCIRRIIADSSSADTASVASFTSEDRNVWAWAREELLRCGNEEVLEKVDSALFCMSLDVDWVYRENSAGVAVDSVRQLIHGSDSGNRWFDKSFTLIVSADGAVGLNMEHAWGDGVSVMRFIDEVVRDTRENDFVSRCEEPKFAPGRHPVEQLRFKTDRVLSVALEEARKKFSVTASTVTMDGFIESGFGRNDCKREEIGPDSLMQSAFQIAFYRLTGGKCVPTYESCSTAIFRHGRTETLRPCTTETKTLATAFHRVEEKKRELADLMRAASKKHMALTKLAAQGQGWDRHLFALRELASKRGEETAEIFLDDAYQTMSKNVMSTSTLSSRNMTHGGFCPVVPNGFGIAYRIEEEIFGTYVSSYKQHANCKDMQDALRDTFADMRKVLAK